MASMVTQWHSHNAQKNKLANDINILQVQVDAIKSDMEKIVFRLDVMHNSNIGGKVDTLKSGLEKMQSRLDAFTSVLGLERLRSQGLEDTVAEIQKAFDAQLSELSPPQGSLISPPASIISDEMCEFKVQMIKLGDSLKKNSETSRLLMNMVQHSVLTSQLFALHVWDLPQSVRSSMTEVMVEKEKELCRRMEESVSKHHLDRTLLRALKPMEVPKISGDGGIVGSHTSELMTYRSSAEPRFDSRNIAHKGPSSPSSPSPLSSRLLKLWGSGGGTGST